MNTEKKIERCLRAAPKPPTPDGLLDKLRQDVTLKEVKTRRAVICRWFAPSGGRVSLWRVAAAAAIAIIVLLPLSYGAFKAVRDFIIVDRITFEYPDEDDSKRSIYSVTRVVVGDDPDGLTAVPFTEEEKGQYKGQMDEIHELRKAGKYEKTYKPENDFVIDGVKHRYFEAHYTLSNGRVVTLGASEPAED